MKNLLLLAAIGLISCNSAGTKKEKSQQKNSDSAAPMSVAAADGLSDAPVINYTVPDEGKITRLAQPSNKTCWATVATMMRMWKDKKTLTIADYLTNLSNPVYKISFDKGDAINSIQKVPFLKDAGLKFEYPASFLPSYLETQLKTHGPLWVTTHEGSGQNFSFVHARICIGIFGDGTPEGTFLKLIDPNGGVNVPAEEFKTFILKYENASGINIQLVHW